MLLDVLHSCGAIGGHFPTQTAPNMALFDTAFASLDWPFWPGTSVCVCVEWPLSAPLAHGHGLSGLAGD